MKNLPNRDSEAEGECFQHNIVAPIWAVESLWVRERCEERVIQLP